MRSRLLALGLFLATPALAQRPSNNPFVTPIEANADVIRVNYVEFATLPDIDGTPARAMTLTTEPVTRRIFVSDMRGPLYSLSYDGRTLTTYLDVSDPRWGVSLHSPRREHGVQSFAFHPQFAQPGTPGYGKLYTWQTTSDTTKVPDFRPIANTRMHDMVLLEWTAHAAEARTYEGSPPRELLRIQHPYNNHNGGHMAFRPTAVPGDADYGLLYMGVADGGSGGDPQDMSQNLESAFGKMFLIDPLGRNSANGKYGYPMSNRWANDGNPRTLAEIYAYGIRNGQRFNWDPVNGNLFVADVGQIAVDELSLVTSGANLGWNDWEGSFRFLGGDSVDLAGQRGDPAFVYPVAEYDHADPLLPNRTAAASGVQVYRGTAIPQLTNLILWGDMPTGEIFYLHADRLPQGGQSAIRRILFNDAGQPKTLLQLIQAKNVQQGRMPAPRADMRMGSGPDGQVFILNKYDGVLRLLVP